MELTPGRVVEFCNEATLLNSLQHENIVHCHGVAIMPPAISLVGGFMCIVWVLCIVLYFLYGFYYYYYNYYCYYYYYFFSICILCIYNIYVYCFM